MNHDTTVRQGRFALHRAETGTSLTIADTTTSVTCALSADDLVDLRAVLEHPAEHEPVPDAAPRPVPCPKPSAIPVAPRPAPVFTTATGDTSPGTDLSVDGMAFLPSARTWLERLGLSRAHAAEIVNDPDDEWIDETGTKTVCVRGEHAVVVGIADETVLSVTTRDHALRRRPQTAGVPRGHGGSGTRYPTSLGELDELIRARGGQIAHVGSGHRRVDYRGASATLSTTPSEYRSLRNTIKALESQLGIDLRRDSMR